MTTVDGFISLHRELLQLEYRTEIDETERLFESATHGELQAQGLVLLKMAIVEISTGLGAKPLITFERVSHAKERNLPQNKFNIGEIVGVFTSTSGFRESPIVAGVVHALRPTSVTISLDADNTLVEDTCVYHLGIIGSEITHKRHLQALTLLEKNRYHPLADICFDNAKPRFIKTHTPENLEFLTLSSLNKSQKIAIAHALNAQDIAVIHGPPGTGKTTTLVALVIQHLRIQRFNGERNQILLCAPSNAAVDNIAEALIAAGVSRVVRVGHPSRAAPSVEAVTLSYLVSKSDDSDVCRDICLEISNILKQKVGYAKLKDLRKTLKEKQDVAAGEVLRGVDVILTTCTGSFSLYRIPGLRLSLCIIDEAAQALEVDCWLPFFIGKCEKLILAGDHQQLPAVVKSEEAAKRGLTTTLFARLEKMHSEVFTLLTEQYRMNEKIMRWSSFQFYENRLTAHASVADRTLRDSRRNNSSRSPFYLTEEELFGCPLIFIDTADSLEMREARSGFGESKYNPGEAVVACKYAQFLHEHGIEANQIAVIAPYNRQINFIKESITPALKPCVATIDSFQGREREVVILSLTRSNAEKVIGFLADARRLNVAVTRAKRQLFIIGDSTTLRSDPILASLISHCDCDGLLLPLAALLDESDLQVVRPVEVHIPKPPPEVKRKAESVEVFNARPPELFTSMVVQGRRRRVFVADDLDDFFGNDHEPIPPAEIPEPIKPVKVVKPKQKPPKEEEEDIDAILDEVLAASKKCGKCGDKLSPSALHCQLCRVRFCFKHLQAEIHGCAEKARVAARGSFHVAKATPKLHQRLEHKIQDAQKVRVKKK